MARKSKTIADWFDQQFDLETDNCIIWPFGTSAGYGRLRYGGKEVKPHRLACIKAHGKPPAPQMEAAHRCGVCLCFNKRHLYWATAKQNGQDKVAHGRSPRGQKNSHAKLTEDQVREIRASLKSASVFAAQYGLNINTIYKIRNGVNWGWLND